MEVPIRYSMMIPSLRYCFKFKNILSSLTTDRVLNYNTVKPCRNTRWTSKCALYRPTSEPTIHLGQGSRSSSVQLGQLHVSQQQSLCHSDSILLHPETSKSSRSYSTSRNCARNKVNNHRRTFNFVDITQSAEKQPINILEAEKKDRERQRQRSHENIVQRLKNISMETRKSNHNLFDLQYENLNEKDETHDKLRKIFQSEKHSQYRKRSGSIILEGSRLVKDALLAGAQAVCLCFCRPEILEQLGEAQGLLNQVKLYKIAPASMKMFSDTVTPGGLLGIFKKPDQGEVICPAQNTLPIALVCDSLKDPGNAGTLIRTAAAIGCRRIFATEGCVNLWERKVLRSAMGSHFNMAIYTGVSWSDVNNYLSPQCQVYLANNFTAVTLGHAFDSQLDPEKLVQGVERARAEFEVENTVPDINKPVADEQEQDLSEYDLYRFHNVPLPVYEYSEIPLVLKENDNQGLDDSKNSCLPEVALVIGSEADGLSASAKKFAFDHYGAYVTIPMNETTNSLNSGVAGSVILYEFRKKMSKLK